MVEQVEVIFKKETFHGLEFCNRSPPGLRRIVGAADLGQAAVAEIEAMRMRDRSPAQTAVGMIEDGDALQGHFKGGIEQAEAGFFAQLANRALQDALTRLEETARYRPQALSRRMPTFDEEDVRGRDDDRVHGHERTVSPDPPVLLEGQMLTAQLAVMRQTGPALQIMNDRRR